MCLSYSAQQTNSNVSGMSAIGDLNNWVFEELLGRIFQKHNTRDDEGLLYNVA